MNQSINLTLSVSDVNLILEALGAAPYARVASLVQSVITQAKDQVEPKADAQD